MKEITLYKFQLENIIDALRIIPCENYQEAQEWCYKFTNKHLMI